MTRLFVRHGVEDFERWKQGYDEFEPKRDEYGVTDQAVYRSADDPNDVTVTHDFASAEEASKFISSDELRQRMAELGVKGPPETWITEQS